MNKVASQPLFNIKHSIILSLHRQSTSLEDLLGKMFIHNSNLGTGKNIGLGHVLPGPQSSRKECLL